jgi:hypothetical protein
MSISGFRGQRKNDRRFPGIKGFRPDRKKMRQEEAEARNLAYQALSLEEKTLRNPKKFAVEK